MRPKGQDPGRASAVVVTGSPGTRAAPRTAWASLHRPNTAFTSMSAFFSSTASAFDVSNVVRVGGRGLRRDGLLQLREHLLVRLAIEAVDPEHEVHRLGALLRGERHRTQDVADGDLREVLAERRLGLVEAQAGHQTLVGEVGARRDEDWRRRGASAIDSGAGPPGLRLGRGLDGVEAERAPRSGLLVELAYLGL